MWKVKTNKEDMKKLQEDFMKNRMIKNKLFLDSMFEKYSGKSSSDEIDWDTLKVKKNGKWSKLKEEHTNPRGAILLSDKPLEFINQVRELSLKDYWGNEIEENDEAEHSSSEDNFPSIEQQERSGNEKAPLPCRDSSNPRVCHKKNIPSKCLLEISHPSKAECSSLITEDDPTTKQKEISEKKSPYPCSSKNTGSRPKKNFPSNLTLETSRKMKMERPSREVTPQIKQKGSGNEETTYSGRINLKSHHKKRISLPVSLENNNPVETEQPKVILKKELKKSKDESSPHSSNGESYLCSPRKRRISVEISSPAKKRILRGVISNTPIDLIFERNNVNSSSTGESVCIDHVSESKRKSVLRK